MMPLEDRSTEVEPDAHIKASSSNEDDPENEEIAGGEYTIYCRFVADVWGIKLWYILVQAEQM